MDLRFFFLFKVGVLGLGELFSLPSIVLVFWGFYSIVSKDSFVISSSVMSAGLDFHGFLKLQFLVVSV